MNKKQLELLKRYEEILNHRAARIRRNYIANPKLYGTNDYHRILLGQWSAIANVLEHFTKIDNVINRR